MSDVFRQIRLVQLVWSKAIPVINYDPAIIRKDRCGAWIRFEDYGNRNSEYGWEIDHIVPTTKGGTDDLSNLQPLRWDNNAAKGNRELVCKIKADGIHNKIAPGWNIIFE